MNWETLLSLGDSITIGARSYLGYPEICASILEKKLLKDWNVINHATNGFTTIDLARSLNTILNSYKEIYPSIISIMIGTNDIKNNTTISEFTLAYRLLIIKAKLLAVNNNIVIIKIPRFTNHVFYPYNYGMNNNIIEFNQLIDKLSLESHIRTLEFILDDDDFFDGVHLSTKGSEHAGAQLARFILKDKGFEDITDLSQNAVSAN